MVPWLSEAEWGAMMRGFVGGRYQLLLGAGASVDATSPNGAPPAGWALAKAMARDFNIPGEPDGDLRGVFALARKKQTATGEDVMSYLRQKYTNCTAPDWYRCLVRVPWRYIWSLNIDDVVDDAYRSSFAADAISSLVSVSWVDRHHVPVPGEVIHVQLHGSAKANSPDDVVFDISTYLLAASQGHRWHNIFADRYTDTPTVIVGARLAEEIDLEKVLSRNRLSVDDDEPPSIIVLPTISDFDEARFRDWNLIPVHTTAAEFFGEVEKELGSYAVKYAATPETAPSLMNPHAVSFMSQWELIDPPGDRKVDRYHDFYGGHEPEYSDIVAGLDAYRNVRHELMEEIKEPDGQRVLVLSGPPFAGKSTAAMRLLRDMVDADKDWHVYRIDQELRPKIDAIIWWLRHFPKTVLFSDGVADFAPDFANLTKRADELSVPLHFVGVERISRIKEVEREMARHVAYRRRDLSSDLVLPEVNRLLKKLKGPPPRLGVLLGVGRADQRKYFLSQHRGELFSALSELEGADGFVERVRRKYSSLGSAGKREAFHVVAVAAALGYGLSFGLCMAVSGLTPSQLDQAIREDANFAEIVVVRRSRMYPRHRVFGTRMLRTAFRPEDNVLVTQRLARALAPDLSRAAIHERTYAYRLARQLLDYQVLGKLIGPANLESWYASLQEEFDWNARFWEQRALAASNDSRHAPAVSWARKAVLEWRDALTLNTLAVVLLRKAFDEGQSEGGLIDGYLEATALLEEARIVGRVESEYPYVTFFEYSLDWDEKRSAVDLSRHRDMIRRWDDWMRQASDASVFENPRGRSQLQKWQARWLKLGIDRQPN